MEPLHTRITKVFWISLAISIVFVGWGITAPQLLSRVMGALQAFFLDTFGWFYQLTATFFLLLALFLIVSKYGKIKLGKDDDKPDFNRLTWFAMLFSAGMGIGLLFFGVGEPISHYAAPPAAQPGTDLAAHEALSHTYLHWGFHAWAIYSTIALALAYFKFRKGYPGLMSAALYPLFGERMKGGLGITVDTVAVFATIFGVAASLGLGAGQINGGLTYLFGLPNHFAVQFIIVAVVTVLFILSATTGIQKGIRILSNANMVLALLLFFSVLLLGPTIFLLELFVTTLGRYVQNLPSMGLRLAPFDPVGGTWIKDWTIFYWAWWIAWSPFVGTFIARVSKGRTVREFVLGVLVVPSLVCVLWFAVFGGTALHLEHVRGFDISSRSLETAIFYVFEQLPGTMILSLFTLLLIALFFITSADSATFVLGMQTTNGSLNPPNMIKVIWGLVLSASAVVLMLSGGLEAMQTAIIVSALPLAFVLIGMIASLLKSFAAEHPPKPKTGEPVKKERSFPKRKAPAR